MWGNLSGSKSKVLNLLSIFFFMQLKPRLFNWPLPHKDKIGVKMGTVGKFWAV